MLFRGTFVFALSHPCVSEPIPMWNTTDWRAVCGRTARTVRRAGTAKAVPDPYRIDNVRRDPKICAS